MPLKFTDEKLHVQAIADAKRKFRVYPSAYANGWMTKRYKQLYAIKKGKTTGAFKGRSDSLTGWFKEGWVGVNSSGTIVGECGGGETRGKVKCLPKSKAEALSKRARAVLARRKQRQDPDPDRTGAPVMVSSKLDAVREDKAQRRYIGPNQMGAKCGRGWHGVKGACERAKHHGGVDAAVKASRLRLADKIRKKKGMSDRNAPKPEPTISLPTAIAQEKHVRPPIESISVFNGNYDDWSSHQSGRLRSGDDISILFSKRKTEKALEVIFKVNYELSAGTAKNPTKNAAQVMYAVKSRLINTMARLPDGMILYNKPHTKDGKGDGRTRIYQKAGFGEQSKNGGMYGVIIQGKLWPLTQSEYKVLKRKQI